MPTWSIVADVYAAGEAPIEGVDRDGLVEGLQGAAAIAASLALDGPGALAGIVARDGAAGDYVVCLGAGDITQWAYALPEELAALG